MDLGTVSVYGLDCRYDREVKKRGKGSLAKSSRERSCSTASGQADIDSAPMTPATSASSPESSPGAFHLAIPPSHLFGGHVPEGEDGFAARVPFGPRQLQHNAYEPDYSFYKTETVNRGSFSSDFRGGISRGDNSIGVQQSPCDQALEPTSSQPWSRAYGAFGEPKDVPYSNFIPVPQGNFQLLPYIPLCPNYHTTPPAQLYPGLINWLPPSPDCAPPEYGMAIPGEEGAYSLMFPTIPIDLIRW